MIFFVASVGLYLGRYVQTIHPEHSYYKEMVMKTDKVLFLYVFVHSFASTCTKHNSCLLHTVELTNSNVLVT